MQATMTNVRPTRKSMCLSSWSPRIKRSGKLPATLAKARPPCAGFSAGLTKVLRSARRGRKRNFVARMSEAACGIPDFAGAHPGYGTLVPLRHALECASRLGRASACVALLEQASRHEHPRAAAAQRVSPERGRVARQHDERDEDVLAETAGVFTQAYRIVGWNELEPVAREQTRHLPVTLRTSEHQGAAHDGNVVEIASLGEITRELRQRLLEADVHLSRPGNGRPLPRHGRDLLVPQMQVDEALSGTTARAVRQAEIAIEPGDSDTQNAAWVAGKFDDGLPAAQRAVESEDDALQPGGPAFLRRRSDESQSSQSEHMRRQGRLAAMIQSINLLWIPISPQVSGIEKFMAAVISAKP